MTGHLLASQLNLTRRPESKKKQGPKKGPTKGEGV